MKKNLLPILESLKANNSKYLFTALGTLYSLSSMAQSPENLQTVSSLSLFANPLFNVLLGVIILLLIIIVMLGGVLKSVAEFTVQKKDSNKGTIISTIAFIAFISFTQNAIAQTTSETTSLSHGMDLPNDVLYLMLSVIAFEVLIIGILISCIRIFTKKEIEETIVIIHKEPSLFEKLNASVAIENERDILLDHNYDGIQELDNDLPPWWKYGFYVTILFAVVYLINYHVIGTGALQTEEYNKSIQMAKIAKEEYEKMNANNVNESSVTMLTDKAQIATGGTIFKETCFACHGKFGEGGVGPNLTDDYWLHGGSIKDIFTSIKYGWPDKGMKSWEADFSPVQIQELASYVKTLRGSNPPNPKVKQGDLYIEPATVSDSAKTVNAKVLSGTDSIKSKME